MKGAPPVQGMTSSGMPAPAIVGIPERWYTLVVVRSGAPVRAKVADVVVSSLAVDVVCWEVPAVVVLVLTDAVAVSLEVAVAAVSADVVCSDGAAEMVCVAVARLGTLLSCA